MLERRIRKKLRILAHVLVIIKLFSHKKKNSLNFEVTRLLTVSDKQKYIISQEISKTFLLNDYIKFLCHITQIRDVWVFFLKKVKYVQMNDERI